MSAITALSAPEPGLVRIARPIAEAVSAPEPIVSQQPARTEPAPRTVAPDVARDGRFDTAEGGANTHVVQRLVQQITATLAYGAHISVVSTGTSVHATIDVSA